MSKFEEIMTQASRLMNDERFNSIVNKRGSLYNSNNSTINEQALENRLFGFSDGEECASNKSQGINEGETIESDEFNFNSDGARKMPKAILESFRNNPINFSQSLEGEDEIAKVAKKINGMQQKQQLNENILRKTENTNGIDYSIIKSIVSECIDSKLKMLNESASGAMRGFRITDGNKIQFIDQRGNLYEGVLKLKRKAAKK